MNNNVIVFDMTCTSWWRHVLADGLSVSRVDVVEVREKVYGEERLNKLVRRPFFQVFYYHYIFVFNTSC